METRGLFLLNSAPLSNHTKALRAPLSALPYITAGICCYSARSGGMKLPSTSLEGDKGRGAILNSERGGVGVRREEAPRGGSWVTWCFLSQQLALLVNSGKIIKILLGASLLVKLTTQKGRVM